MGSDEGLQLSSESLENAGARGHSSERDLMALLQSAQTYIERKLVEELLALRGVKFQLAKEVEL